MQIPQAKNAKVDFLARLASLDDYNAPSELCIEIRGQSSTEGEQILKEKKKKKKEVEWMTPIIRYLKEGLLPKDKRKQGRYKLE